MTLPPRNTIALLLLPLAWSGYCGRELKRTSLYSTYLPSGLVIRRWLCWFSRCSSMVPTNVGRTPAKARCPWLSWIPGGSKKCCQVRANDRVTKAARKIRVDWAGAVREGCRAGKDRMLRDDCLDEPSRAWPWPSPDVALDTSWWEEAGRQEAGIGDFASRLCSTVFGPRSARHQYAPAGRRGKRRRRRIAREWWIVQPHGAGCRGAAACSEPGLRATPVPFARHTRPRRLPASATPPAPPGYCSRCAPRHINRSREARRHGAAVVRVGTPCARRRGREGGCGGLLRLDAAWRLGLLWE